MRWKPQYRAVPISLTPNSNAPCHGDNGRIVDYGEVSGEPDDPEPTQRPNFRFGGDSTGI
jgi:hypothetical protein